MRNCLKRRQQQWNCIYTVRVFANKTYKIVPDSHLQEAKNAASLPLLYQTSQKTALSHLASSLTYDGDIRIHCEEHH